MHTVMNSTSGTAVASPIFTNIIEDEKLKPDLDETLRFLTLLDEEAESFHFQTFDDKKLDRRDLTFSKQLPSDQLDDLANLNLKEAGVFVCINRIKEGEARKKTNVASVRAVFADDDIARPTYRTEWPLEPHIVVESSPGKYHYYWLVEGLKLEQFTTTQKYIAEKFETDRSVSDSNRVMRLPGFWHHKSSPFMTCIVQENAVLPYGCEAILKAFPAQDVDYKSGSKLGPDHDPILRELSTRSMLLGEIKDQKGGWRIQCPWWQEHTDRDKTGTVYLQAHTGGYEKPAFHCHHDHCQGRHIGHLSVFLEMEGAIDTPHSDVPNFQSLAITPMEWKTARLTAPCIVENYLYADVAALGAPGGVGKTTQVLYELICIVLGKELWGLEVLLPGPCIMVSAEDRREYLVGRLRELAASMGLTDEEIDRVQKHLLIWDVTGLNLRLVTMDKNIELTSLADAIIERATGLGIRVIVFDPTVSFGASEEAINSNGQALVTAARRIHTALDCCVRYVHHTGQEAAREKFSDQYALRGGTAFSDGSRMIAILTAWGPESQRINSKEIKPPFQVDPESSIHILHRPKLTYAPPHQPMIWIVRRSYQYEWYIHKDPEKDTGHAEAENAVVELLEQMRREDRWPTKSSLDKGGYYKKAKLTKTQMNEAIHRLLEGDLIYEKDVTEEHRKGGLKKYLAVRYGIAPVDAKPNRAKKPKNPAQ